MMRRDGTISVTRETKTPQQLAFSSLAGWLAFGFGSGLSRHAPGTAGSAAALLPALLLWHLPMGLGLVVVLLAFVVGVWCCQVCAEQMGQDDPGAIVWDEFVGVWLVLVLVPNTVVVWVLAWLVFRGFDIIKPWPISALERRYHGGLGIMLDDVIAALMAVAVMHAGLALWPV